MNPGKSGVCNGDKEMNTIESILLDAAIVIFAFAVVYYAAAPMAH
jgi:hypothetical protein